MIHRLARLAGLPVTAALAACGPAAPRPAPAGAPSNAAPAPDAPAPGLTFADVDRGDAFELYDAYQDAAFDADLDGDGQPERVEFTCDPTIAIVVGEARAHADVQISELMGCAAAAVPLRAGSPARHVLVTAYEHEEVGPPEHAIFEVEGGAARAIWQGEGQLTVLRGGAWITDDTDCDWGRGAIVTTASLMQLTADGDVATTEDVHEEPVEPEACAEP